MSAAKGTYCARAQVMRTERITISIEMRPPKKGELGWTVSMGADAKEALLQVIDGRGTWDEGECGYGTRAVVDWPEVERDEWVNYETKERSVDESRCITVVLSQESSETGEVVLL